MAVEDDPASLLRDELRNWLPVKQAADVVGCSDGYIRRLLICGDRRLVGEKLDGRDWVVHKKCLAAFADGLSARSKGKRPARAKRTPKRRTR
jgi:hypothetical protein